MNCSACFDLKPGITAVIGSGGKTTFLRTVGEELARSHRVLLCTTTKIYPFPGLPLGCGPEELEQLSRDHRLVCGGVPLPESGKLGALPCALTRLTACFDYILVEADGAAGRPLKAHGDHEPVIPPGCGRIIHVVGASGFGLPIAEAAHRPERYAQLAGVSQETAVTPELAAAVLNRERLGGTVFLNQVEEIQQLAWAGRFAAAAEAPVIAGSLKKGECFSCEL